MVCEKRKLRMNVRKKVMVLEREGVAHQVEI